MRQFDNLATPGASLRAADLNELHKEIKRSNQLSVEGGSLTQGPSGPTISVDKEQSFYAMITEIGMNGFHSWEERQIDLKGGWLIPLKPRKGNWKGEAAKEINGVSSSVGTIVELKTGGNYTSISGRKEKVWLFASGGGSQNRLFYCAPNGFLMFSNQDRTSHAKAAYWTIHSIGRYENFTYYNNAPEVQAKIIIDPGLFFSYVGGTNFDYVKSVKCGPIFGLRPYDLFGPPPVELVNPNFNFNIFEGSSGASWQYNPLYQIWYPFFNAYYGLIIDESHLVDTGLFYDSTINFVDGQPKRYKVFSFNQKTIERFSHHHFINLYGETKYCSVIGAPSSSKTDYVYFNRSTNYGLYKIIASNFYNAFDPSGNYFNYLTVRYTPKNLEIVGPGYYTTAPNKIVPTTTIGGSIGTGLSGSSGTSGTTSGGGGPVAPAA